MTAAERTAETGVGELLRAARERAGLSVRELAARLGTSAATVSDAERGGDLRRTTLLRYLEALPGLTPHRLLEAGPEPPPRADDAAWELYRDALGFSVGQLRFEVDVDASGQRRSELLLKDVRCTRGSLDDPERRLGVLATLLRGSDEARRRLQGVVREGNPSSFEIEDGAFRHRFTVGAGRASYARRRADGTVAPRDAALPASAPCSAGVSLPVDLPSERLEIVVRFASGAIPWPARACAWADGLALASDEADLAPFLYPEDAAVVRGPRRRSLRLTLRRPMPALHHGIAWAPAAAARPKPAARPEGGAAVKAAREAAGLSQRELAVATRVSPATIAGIERGQDARRSHLLALRAALPELRPEDLLSAVPSRAPWTRRDLWEAWRALLGLEADMERKTLVITAEGDAHAVCETLRLRRVRPAATDLRLRHASVRASGRRFPTELKAIEEALAAETDGLGLKARIVERQQGRLIHEITVPRGLAQEGVSYSRRLFDARFFDPNAETEGTPPPRHDGAALVPFHPVRRLRLAIRFPAGRFPARTWFGVHPRMMLSEPLPGGDVAAALHPDGLHAEVSPRTRTLVLEADYPLPGFMYDIFWERPED